MLRRGSGRGISPLPGGIYSRNQLQDLNPAISFGDCRQFYKKWNYAGCCLRENKSQHTHSIRQLINGITSIPLIGPSQL